MEAVHSFAPLAARLAAKVDEIRPADGAEATWDGFMALFFCAILQMLILLCEALDARAAADARLAAAPAVRRGTTRPAVATRVATARAPRLTLVPGGRAVARKRDAVLSATDGTTRSGPWLVWSRDPGPARAAAGPPVAIPPEKSAFRLGLKHAYFVTIKQRKVATH